MLGLALIGATAAAAHNPSSIEGVWRSPGGNSIIKIATCGNAPCGTIVWATDKAKHDSRKTTAHLVGTHLLTHLEHHRDGSWRGKLFIPDRNMHASAKIHRAGPNELNVSGCKIICKSAVWTAYKHPLPTDGSKIAPK